jgi:hypothetical protein
MDLVRFTHNIYIVFFLKINFWNFIGLSAFVAASIGATFYRELFIIIGMPRHLLDLHRPVLK